MANFRSFGGRLLLGLGLAAAFLFNSPQLRFGMRGFFFGGAIAVVGLWLLAGPSILSAFRRKQIDDRPSGIDPLLPVQILKLAKKRDGILTVSEVAIELNVPLEQAEQGLKACIKTGNAFEDFALNQGYAYYRFPEYLDPDGKQLPE